MIFSHMEQTIICSGMDDSSFISAYRTDWEQRIFQVLTIISRIEIDKYPLQRL